MLLVPGGNEWKKKHVKFHFGQAVPKLKFGYGARRIRDRTENDLTATFGTEVSCRKIHWSRVWFALCKVGEAERW